MNFWNKLQDAEPKIVARVRAAVFVLAALSATQAHAIADALQYPALEKWILRAAAICGGIALLLRAGDKTPDNVVTQDQLVAKPYQVPRSGGFATLKTVGVILAAATLVSACAFIHKQFGSDVGSNLATCQTAELQPAKDALIGDLAALFATALSGDLPALLLALEHDAVTQFGPPALTALKCDATVLASGYEAMHSTQDAGPSPEMRSLLLLTEPPPREKLYLRAKDYASKP